MGRGPGSNKRFGRDETMWVAIHKCMEQCYEPRFVLYCKLAKMLCLSYLLNFLCNKIREPEDETGFSWKRDGKWIVVGEAQINVYTCK
jgi:hypothetical protein